MLGIFLLCLFITGCGRNISESELQTISYPEFESRLDAGEDFILIIGRDDCPNCVALSDMIEREQIELGKTLYMKYSIDERETFLPAVEEYFTDIEMIPYYAVIDNGKIVKTGQGYSEKSDYIDFIKENQNQ